MGIEVKYNLKQRVLDDINSQESSAYQKVQEKKEQYEAAKKALSVFQDKLSKAKANFMSAQKNKSSDASWLKARFEDAQTQADYADIDVSVFRSSLQGSLSYYSKINNQAFMANSILGG